MSTTSEGGLVETQCECVWLNSGFIYSPMIYFSAKQRNYGPPARPAMRKRREPEWPTPRCENHQAIDYFADFRNFGYVFETAEKFARIFVTTGTEFIQN